MVLLSATLKVLVVTLLYESDAVSLGFYQYSAVPFDNFDVPGIAFVIFWECMCFNGCITAVVNVLLV